MLLIGHDYLVARWCGIHLGIRDFGPCAAVGVLDSDKNLVAGAVFNNYRPPNIEISFVSTSPKWATKGNITGILSYPFRIGCERITAVVAAENIVTQKFLQRLGFVIEGYHPRALRTGAAITYGLLKEQCRWLGEASGQVSAEAA